MPLCNLSTPPLTSRGNHKVGATFQSYGEFVPLWSDNMYSSDKTREVPLTGCGKDCQPFVSRLEAKQASAFCIFIPSRVS